MDRIDIENGLFETLEQMPVIDCHEHMFPEKVRLETPVDAVTFFCHYNRFDLVVAGMKPPKDPWAPVIPADIPFEKRWKMIKPYLPLIRHTSYAKAAFMSLKKFYGFDDFNDATVKPITEAMRKANKKGIYDRVFDACNIKLALTQCASTRLNHKRMVPVMPLRFETDTWELLSRQEAWFGKVKINTLDDLLAGIDKYVGRVKKEGAVGMKMVINPYGEPDRKAAEELFNKLKRGEEKVLRYPNALRDYVADEAVKAAEKHGLVIAVHTGYWGDLRLMDPLHLIPFLVRHPDARFDVYHLGFPWVRQCIQLARNYPNVWLNLAWNAIVSEKVHLQAVDELIDQIPSNKILAFGGDYAVPVEKIWGHLTIARRNFAKVFAGRIADGDMTEKQAVIVLKKWLYDNPIALYGLKNRI